MRLNTCIVFGGKSVEHEVSIITASQFMENIDKEKYNPIPLYVTKDNEFYYDEAMKGISYFKDIDLNSIKNKALKVQFIKEKNQVQLIGIKGKFLKRLFPVDLIILSVHGTNCEDGTLSAYFNFLDLPYVGSDLLPSSISQNKVFTKIILEKKGLPVVPYVDFYQHVYERDSESILLACEELTYPLIIKPANLGSSVGVSRADNREELIDAIHVALEYDAHILVEKAIVKMKEYNCAVIGNRDKNEASDIEEVLKNDKILSYQDKYIAGNKSSKGMVSTKRKIPADLSDELTQAIKQYAKRTFESTGNSGVSRIDFIYDEANEQVYINEINTIPGSFAYYLWDKKRLNYTELIDRLIDVALSEYKQKENRTFTYDTNILSLADYQINKLK